MASASLQLRRFVKRALVDATGTPAPDRDQLAAAFDLLWERLRRRLQLMFGATAVLALFARAIHLATAEFPWLQHFILPKDVERSAAKALEGHGSLLRDDVHEGLAAVLAYNIALLSTFVGDDLVLPLVQEAWGAARLAEAPAKTQDDL
jgi:hypothetical protein